MGISTFYDEKNVYSTDMMIAYVNTFKHPTNKLSIEQFFYLLDEKGWGKPPSDLYSPNDVLEAMKKKTTSGKNIPAEWQFEVDRINNADLTCPILVFQKSKTEYLVCDGMHRICKAKGLEIAELPVYVFNKTLMKKFLLDNNLDWSKIKAMKPFNVIQLFYKRFKNFKSK